VGLFGPDETRASREDGPRPAPDVYPPSQDGPVGGCSPAEGETGPTQGRLPERSGQEIPVIQARSFVEQMREAAAPLIDFVLSPAVRNHSYWGHALPFDAPTYGAGRSPGWVFRVDGILCADGRMRFAEMDFGAQGWSTMAQALVEPEREEFCRSLGKFVAEDLGFQNLWIAAGPRTSYAAENAYFARVMDDYGYNVSAVNIDDHSSVGDDTAVLRLFYDSEIERRPAPPAEYLCKESVLDSKAVFALVHDAEMTAPLEKALGSARLEFLRDAMPESYMRDRLNAERPLWFQELLRKKDFSGWVLKATGVEDDYCWGSRGVIVGQMYQGRGARQERWLTTATDGPGQKRLGQRPILQRFHDSVDLSNVWNDVVSGRFLAADVSAFGKPADPAVLRSRAAKPVTARVGIFFFVNGKTGETTSPHQAFLILRQSPLSHGASDALQMACATS
jgi:hypothetical protein